MGKYDVQVEFHKLEEIYDKDDLAWMINDIKNKPISALSQRDLNFLFAVADKYYQYVVSLPQTDELTFI